MSISSNGAGGALDKNAFLQLMMTQMQYQDPLQPQDNSQFIAQLAQFTSLEQMTNVATADQQLLYVNQLSVEQKMIGQTVTVQNPDKTTTTGAVTGLRVVNGEPQLLIGGNSYSLTDVTQIGGNTP